MKISTNALFIVCLISCIVINMDHGIIPACTFEIKQELNISDFFLGILGSLVFAGLVTGSIVRYSHKRHSLLQIRLQEDPPYLSICSASFVSALSSLWEEQVDDGLRQDHFRVFPNLPHYLLPSVGRHFWWFQQDALALLHPIGSGLGRGFGLHSDCTFQHSQREVSLGELEMGLLHAVPGAVGCGWNH